MLIDLHCHTKKTKTGDAITRDVTKDLFIEKVTKANVAAVAITNHNSFDLDQYKDFQNEKFMVWPGIELDVDGINGSRGHCILIVAPEQAENFAKRIQDLTKSLTPDDFRISLNDLAELAKSFNSIVTCHYGKQPSLSDDSIEKLRASLGDIPLFLEPSKLISAGIFLAHSVRSILGSDVQDWNVYEKSSFPELKLEVDSYDHFLRLIKKDKEVIKTFIDKKRQNEFEIAPFEGHPRETLKIQLFNDTNVIIGGKGTGKTRILRAIEKRFNELQSDSVSTYYGADKENRYESITKVELTEGDYERAFGQNTHTEEIQKISSWQIVSLEKTSNYYQWICNKKDVKNFGFGNASFTDVISKEFFEEEYAAYEKNKKHIEAILQNNPQNYLTKEDAETYKELSAKLITLQQKRVIKEFCAWKALQLTGFTITRIKDLYQIKKGKSSKPNSCGLFALYCKCRELKTAATQLMNAMDQESKTNYRPIGFIPGKGYIFVKKELTINPQHTNFSICQSLKANPIKNVYAQIRQIALGAFGPSAPALVSEFCELKDEHGFTSLKDFLRARGDVVKSWQSNPRLITVAESYEASSGEKSMLILNNTLYREKDVFIMDEPELSVGHDFINSVIVPRIIELSKLNKTVIVATHDANIAVRTLPFTTIYRSDDKKTYVGNPFSENMVNLNDPTDTRPWAKTCIETLEGGAIAFRERGDSYGRENL